MRHLLLFLIVWPLCAQTAEQLEAHGVSVADTVHQGKASVRVDALPSAANGQSYAIVKGSRFHNGTIEADLAGKPAANAGAAARGFIGTAFRMQPNRYGHIYLRPTNGRADDQVRRNHSTQYGAQPDFDFDRLRKESPEKYESYVDMEPGIWTKYRIVINGTKARLFANGAVQPCLIVNDMKLGDSEGAVGIMAVGPGTGGVLRESKNHAVACEFRPNDESARRTPAPSGGTKTSA
jgi:hypothetical protein